MTVVNDMLLRYWLCLGVSYGCILWFALKFDLNNYVALDLKERITFRDVMDYYLTNVFDPVPLVCHCPMALYHTKRNLWHHSPCARMVIE
eukprot:5932508-Amphidinium_carterae.1